MQATTRQTTPTRPDVFTVVKGVTSGLKGIGRLAETAGVLGQVGLSWLRGHRPPTPQLMRETFEQLGTTYIKLGQFIASSPSVFPDAYTQEFQKCLDQTTPLPFRDMRRVLEADLSAPVEQIFAHINPQPIASASIAQVYAAKLRTGEDVVIKIQKPGVRNVLLTDLNFLFVSARIMEYLVPNLSMASLSAIVEEIQKGMLEECDFFREARNIEDFQNFLTATGNQDVVAPKVYPQASGARVLTMERLHGAPFTDLESIRHITPNPENTLLTAMNTWFSSLLFCDSFHADVHAGNLLVLENGKVGFIDFGIVGRIKPETWESVSAFIHAIGVADYHNMAKAMLGIGMTDHAVDVDRLAADIKRFYTDIDENAPQTVDDIANVDEQEVNRVMMELLALAKRHGIHFPREFALLLKQLLYFDRYVRILSMEGNIYSDERLLVQPDQQWRSLIEV